jgi:hypothetical protein
MRALRGCEKYSHYGSPLLGARAFTAATRVNLVGCVKERQETGTVLAAQSAVHPVSVDVAAR